MVRRPPSLSTIRRVPILVDAQVLDARGRAWLSALTPPPPVPVAFRAVAVHGKTCRGAKRPDGSRVHLFSAVEHGSGTPLGQVLAESKGFEIAAFAAVLDRIELAGVVVTADALHTQKAHGRRESRTIAVTSVVAAGIGFPHARLRDVTFDEDRSQVCTGIGPRVMATLRNSAIGLIRARQHGRQRLALAIEETFARLFTFLTCGGV